MSVKNSIDTIGKRTRDLPTCSAVPQPPAPQRESFLHYESEGASEILRKLYKKGNYELTQQFTICKIYE
jgi:hypothetical protein